MKIREKRPAQGSQLLNEDWGEEVPKSISQNLPDSYALFHLCHIVPSEASWVAPTVSHWLAVPKLPILNDHQLELPHQPPNQSLTCLKLSVAPHCIRIMTPALTQDPTHFPAPFPIAPSPHITPELTVHRNPGTMPHLGHKGPSRQLHLVSAVLPLKLRS
jgi:hypothetical protein